MRVHQLFEDEEQVILEATDIKGAVAHVQKVFDRAGLIIKVTSYKKDVLICRGSINRTKFVFTIQLTNGKVSVVFDDFNIDKISGTQGITSSGANLTTGSGLEGLKKQVRNFAVKGDNLIAEIRVAKTFLIRLTRCLERISGSIEK